jgi:catechol 2,3-dioxygenase-like lactoylglutathione lyase family enzyme
VRTRLESSAVPGDDVGVARGDEPGVGVSQDAAEQAAGVPELLVAPVRRSAGPGQDHAAALERAVKVGEGVDGFRVDPLPAEVDQGPVRRVLEGNLAAAHRYLTSNGCEVTAIRSGRTRIDFFYVKDPDGNWVEVVSDKRTFSIGTVVDLIEGT